jgi:hypothetical protein
MTLERGECNLSVLNLRRIAKVLRIGLADVCEELS